jgi:RND family efflux transporter MFP subunit
MSKQKSTAIETVPLADRLNNGRFREYEAIIGCVGTSLVLRGIRYMGIYGRLAIHAKPKLDPALILPRQIDYFSKKPAVSPKRVCTLKNVRDVLRCELESENETIRNYCDRVRPPSSMGLPRTGAERKVDVLKHQFAIWMTTCLIAVTVSISAGCSSNTQGAKAPDPTTVEVVQVEQKDVPIYTEWIGTTDGVVNADIKAQVSGYLLKQDYTEGSFVKKGQLLFEIDPRPFQAVVDQGEGQLAQANGQVAQAKAQLTQAEAQLAVVEANQVRTQLDVERYTPLAKQQAVTQQDLDNATQNNVAAKAQVQAAKAQIETARAQIQAANAAVQAVTATVETARLNLSFTRLTSPIDGLAGTAQQQVGALVSPASGPVTTVSTVDPIKVNFTASEQEYLDFHRRYSTPATLEAARRGLRLELILTDGTVYPRIGTYYFADREIGPGTGAIRVAGLFPNPDNLLRPGQYGRVRTSYQTKDGALLIPQRAVTEMQGTYQVAVVGGDNKISIRNVKPSDRAGNLWIIDEGLKPGERVVAEGVQKVRAGMTVVPKPYAAAAETEGK